MSEGPGRGSTGLTELSAVDLAGAIARGDVSSSEVVEAHIERIESVNPALNAVVIKRYEQARAAARDADERRGRGDVLGPLHGVPVTVKEVFDLAGTPSTFGLTSRAGIMAERDGEYVDQLTGAGAIVLGKTNVAQLLIYYESDNPVYGRTNNPWNLARTPGGSSGGEAAIIAAGGSPMGIGTDIGGSMRVPPAFCGIAALKPTMGRTPDPGRFSIPIGQRAVVSQIGVMARRVEDVALGTHLINGVNKEPQLPLGDHRAVDVEKLRVAYYTDDGTLSVAPAVARAVREAADAMRAGGAEVMEWSPPDVDEALHLYFALLSGDAGKGARRLLEGGQVDPRVKILVRLAGLRRSLHRPVRGLLSRMGQPTMAGFLDHFGYTSVAEHWQLVERQMVYQRGFLDALDREQIDVILCPPCALPAYTHGASADLGQAGGYGLLYNLLGFPAGVVPLTRVRPDEEVGRGESRDRVQRAALAVERGSAGLPIGVQVVGRPWREHVVLAAMGALEEVARRRPDYPRTPVVDMSS